MAGIDRDYWLDFAKDGVTKSIESREKAADKLDTFLTWVWGIYTTVFALASLLNYVSTNICQLIFVAQPILIIMLSRYFCTMVSMPSTNNDDESLADPNDVASIIDGFKIIVDNKKKKLGVAKIFTLISIISLSVALVGYNFYDPDKQLKREIQLTKLQKDLNNQKIIPLKLQQSENDSIKIDNEFYDLQLQNLLKKKKINCFRNNDLKYYDTLKNFEK